MTFLLKHFFVFFSRQQKYTLFIIFLQMIVVVILEMLGVAAVLPVLAILISPDISNNVYFARIYEVLGSPSRMDMVVIVLGAFVFLYFLKSIFSIYFTWFQERFLNYLVSDISIQLFSKNIKLPYAKHLHLSSGYLIRNIVDDSGHYGKSVRSLITLSTGIVTFIGILGLLVWVQPVITSFVIIFVLIIASGFHFLFKNKIAKLGRGYRYHKKELTHFLLQGFGNIIYIILSGGENNIKKKYATHSIGLAQVNLNKTIISSLPRVIFEFFLVIGLVSLIFIFLFSGHPLDDIVPTIGLFSVAAFRLLPIIIRITTTTQQLQYYMASINQVADTLMNTDSKNIRSVNLDTIVAKPPAAIYSSWKELTLNKISYQYNDAQDYAIRDINIKIKKGETTGIIGESGGGKSTLANILTGLLAPQSGSLSLDGIGFDAGTKAWQSQIGYVPQHIYLFDDTIAGNIAFGVEKEDINQQAMNGAIEAAQLSTLISELEHGLDTFVGENGVRLSGGQKQRIGIARALYHQPSLLMLDEPSSALDVETEANFMASIERVSKEKTIIIIAHRLSTIRNCDRIFRINGGCVVDEGTFDEIIL